MKRFSRLQPRSDLLFLLLLVLLAYGLLAPTLGLYWDEFPMAWIAERFDGAGLARYFSTNRPVWGLFYQVTTPLLGSTPWHWQVFGLLTRFATAAACWLLVRETWPRKSELALFTAALFAVYPGFGQQSLGLLYGHFFIVLALFLLSLYLHLRALRDPKRRLWLTAAALLCSAANLFSMEYFFLLELLRPLFVWAALSEDVPDWRARLKRTALSWLPYGAVLAAAGIWRVFLFPYQTQNYELGGASRSAGLLLSGVLSDLWTATLAAWGKVFALPSAAELGARTWQVYLVVVLAALAVSAGYLFLRTVRGDSVSRRPALSAIAIGLVAILLAGGPFWATGLPVGSLFPNDRFTLPFMLGVSLALGGLLLLIPGPRALRSGVLVVLLALAVGVQFQNASDYRRDWTLQKSFFWQLTWRAPALEPGTALFSSDLPMRHYSDNSLTAPLNWIYDPDGSSQDMSFALFWPSFRQGHPELPSLSPGTPISLDYLATSFSGSTSRSLALVYAPPACLRILDPELEPLNITIPEALRAAAKLSDLDRILPQGQASLPPQLYTPEPAHGWCYYFERADLARQQGDWPAVADLGDQAFALGDYPNDPMERLPFIEGYAHIGRWERALELTREAGDITPLMQPVLCRLWQRIGAQTEKTAEQQAAVASVRCGE